MTKLCVDKFNFVIVILLVSTIAFFSALYSFPELDEGFFIQVAKSMSEGSIMYQDIPGMYGPLFFKLNEIIFSNFGFLHVTSRVFAFLLGLATFILMVMCMRRESPTVVWRSIGYPAIWFLLSSSRFSESLHPGWYISFVLVIISSLILRNSKYQYLFAGICCGLLLGFKMHIGLLAVVAILQIVLINNKVSILGWLRYVPTIMLFILFAIILQRDIQNASLLYLLPFFLTIVLSLLILKSKLEDSKGLWLQLGCYIIAVILTSAFIYGISGYVYGFSNMKYYMLDRPRLWFPNLYSDNSIMPLDAKLEVMASYAFLVLALVLRSKLLIDSLLVLLPVAFLATTQLSPHIFILIHICLFIKCKAENLKVYIPLILLSVVQIFHMHPIAGTQVLYASPIMWLLLGIVSVKELRHGTIIEYLKKAALCLMLILSLLSLPFTQAILSEDRLSFLSSKLNNKEYILIGEKDGIEILKLIDYLKPRLSTGASILTIPRYDSLNLLLGVSPPKNVESYYFFNLSQQELNQVGPILFSSDYIVTFPKSSRSKNVLDSDIFIGNLMKYQEPVFEENKVGKRFSNELFKVFHKKVMN